MNKIHDQDQFGEEITTRDNNDDRHSDGRSSSKRSSSRHGHSSDTKMRSPLISRSVRAKRRRAFLGTYQLSTVDNNSIAESGNYSEKLRQAATKARSAMVSFAAAARLAVLRRSCSFQPAVCGSITTSPSVRLH